MEHDGIDNLIRQRVLLIEEGLDEHGGRAGVVHLAEVEERGGGVQDGDGDAREDGADDLRFFEGGRGVAKREKEALEEGGGLVEGFFDGVVEVDVEALVFGNVVADALEEDGGQEPGERVLATMHGKRWGGDIRTDFWVCADF